MIIFYYIRENITGQYFSHLIPNTDINLPINIPNDSIFYFFCIFFMISKKCHSPIEYIYGKYLSSRSVVVKW